MKYIKFLGMPIALLMAVLLVSWPAASALAATNPDWTTPLNKTIVVMRFDDGYQNQYDNGVLLMRNLGLNGTFYTITSLQGGSYMTPTELRQMQSWGFEIGVHTVSHLTQLSSEQARQEMQAGKDGLTAQGLNIKNFVYPFGDYNTSVRATCLTIYRSCISTQENLNTQVNFDRGVGRVFPVYAHTTVSRVKQFLKTTPKQHALAILMFHEIRPNLDPNVSPYATSPQTFKKIANYVSGMASTGQVQSMTLDQALDAIGAPAGP
jgi:peptidoglycan/xylan/chitin deacetylase (PgdA/CDA1 family)